MASASRHLRRRLHRHLLRSSLFPISTPTPLITPTPSSSAQFGIASYPSFRSFSWSATSADSGPEKSDTVNIKLEGFLSDVPDVGVDGALTVVNGVGDENLWYAPVRALILAFDGYHEATGLPWWIVIATSTLALRLSLMPVLVLQLKKVGKLSELFPKLPPPFPPPFSGISFREQFSLHRKKRRELGCPSYLWSFAFFSVQFPCFLLWMTSIRRMCLDGHPGFDTGGILWFQNLSEFSHGTCGPVFPVLVASLHFINVQISFRNFKASKLPGLLGLFAKYYKIYLDILSLPLLVIGFYIPQGSLVYWVTNSSLTLIQFYHVMQIIQDSRIARQLSLRNTYIRQGIGLPDFNDKRENKVTPTKLSKWEFENLAPERLLELGLRNMATDNYDKALPLLRLATKKDPELVRALIAMGQILFSRKLLTEAANYFERAISKIREDEEPSLLILALFCAGLSHVQQGKTPEGIEYLKRMSKLKEPEASADKACYYQGLVLLGSTLYNEGQKSEAAEYLRRAVDYDPHVEVYLKECEKEDGRIEIKQIDQ